MSHSNPNFYSILGVEPTATMAEISTAYRKLAKIYHPDKPTGDQEKFKEICRANEILSNEDKRKIYDSQGLYGVRSAEQAKARKEHMQATAAAASSNAQTGFFGQTVKMPPGNTIFNNLFNHFFKNGNPSETQSSSSNENTNPSWVTNPPIMHKLAINLKDVYCGCQKTVKYHRNLICQSCYGKGYKPHCQPLSCPICKSTGKINVNP